MSVVKRIETAIGSVMNKILDRWSDPRDELDYSYEKAQDKLKEIKQALVDLTTARNQLENQKRIASSNVANLESQARELLKLGGDDNTRLARLAVEQKITAESQVESLIVQIKDLKEKEQKLIQASKEYEIKVEQFNAQKENLKAQYTAAEAQKKIEESLHGISTEAGDAGDAIRRAADKTDAMNAGVAAVDELSNAGVLTDAFDQRSSVQKQVDNARNRAKVDDELERLRKE